MKMILSDGPASGSRTLDTLFALTGATRLCAGHGLPMAGAKVAGQGEVVRVRIADNTGVSCWPLLTCIGIFYAFKTNGELTDVVAFHAPSGTAKIQSDKSKAGRTGSFGTPEAEAAWYGINYVADAVRVVIAFGSASMAGVENASEEAQIKQALATDTGALLEGVNDDSIFLYNKAGSTMFGMSPQQHWGEPGSVAPQGTRPTSPRRSSVGCCVIM